jgi:hypothetical protein
MMDSITSSINHPRVKLIRTETLIWLLRCFKHAKSTPASLSEATSPLGTALVTAMEDKDTDVRKGAYQCMAALLAISGRKVLGPMLDTYQAKEPAKFAELEKAIAAHASGAKAAADGIEEKKSKPSATASDDNGDEDRPSTAPVKRTLGATGKKKAEPKKGAGGAAPAKSAAKKGAAAATESKGEAFVDDGSLMSTDDALAHCKANFDATHFGNHPTKLQFVLSLFGFTIICWLCGVDTLRSTKFEEVQPAIDAISERIKSMGDDARPHIEALFVAISVAPTFAPKLWKIARTVYSITAMVVNPNPFSS